MLCKSLRVACLCRAAMAACARCQRSSDAVWLRGSCTHTCGNASGHSPPMKDSVSGGCFGGRSVRERAPISWRVSCRSHRSITGLQWRHALHAWHPLLRAARHCTCRDQAGASVGARLSSCSAPCRIGPACCRHRQFQVSSVRRQIPQPWHADSGHRLVLRDQVPAVGDRNHHTHPHRHAGRYSLCVRLWKSSFSKPR